MTTGTAPPSLRQEQLDVTRRRILDALVDLVSTEGVHDLSVQDVADRAGVSHRTVYRHFPDKSALLDGLSDWLDQRIAERHPMLGQGAEPLDLVDGVARTWEMFEELDTVTEAMVRLMVSTGARLPSRHNRTARIRRSFEDALTHLDPADADAVVAVLRTLGTSVTWSMIRRDFDVDPGRARDAFVWAASVLLDDLRHGGGPHRTRPPANEAGPA